MTEKNESKTIRFLGYAVPFMLMVYIVSFGPVYAIAANSYLDSFFDTKPVDDRAYLDSVDFFYAPLLWVGKNNQFIGENLGYYRGFCFQKMYPEYSIYGSCIY